MGQTDRPREQALDILRRIEGGAFADSLLDRARRGFDVRDSAFILELVFGVLRNRSRLDCLLDRFSSRPLAKTDAWTRNILRIGAYQVLFLDRVPPSAAVNTAVELAKTFGKKSGYVNGLLRSLERNRASLCDPEAADPVQRLSLLYSHPEWIVRRWVRRFGDGPAEALLRENNRHAPLTIRTNTLRTTRDRLRASLEAEGVTARESLYSPTGLDLSSLHGLRTLSAYQMGWFMVQDEAAQLIGFLLDPRPGETVLDACAAPGGKATHLAELMQNEGRIVALENDPGRLEKIKENSERLGITILTPVCGDATTYREGQFDRILVDAPCSGLGVLRRHPDGRWNKNEAIIPERAALQHAILDNCAALLRPGGVLVYATCTTEPEENEEVIIRFLEKHGNFVLDDPRLLLSSPALKLITDQAFFCSFPTEPSMDGFFGARLLRKH